MKCQKIQESMIQHYEKSLLEAEKSKATIEKYLHTIRLFAAEYAGRRIDKALILEYKVKLGETSAPSSANAAINGFLRFCVKPF